ncbi:MAG: DUF4105 domain-containing protein, partial [bacterium]
PDQMDTFLRHLWELGGNYFDYYYFQENCSYHILSLLEVAKPELHLTDQFWFHVIPSDTVKAVTRYEHLVSKTIYRPSLLSQMNQKRQQFSERQETIFSQVVKDPTSIQQEPFQQLNIPEKALVLDAFLDYAQYQNMKSNKEEDKSIAINNRPILLARSKLRVKHQDESQIVFSTRPEFGHGSDRLKIGFGIHENHGFQEIAYRPAYHDLLAKDTGFGLGSQILFLDLTARYYHALDQFKLDRLHLIDIISLSPYETLFQKKSWRFSIGVDTIKDFDCNFCNTFKTGYGLGLTYRSSHFSPSTLYALLDVEVELSSRLKNGYRVGGGGTIGMFFDPKQDWRIQILANYLRFPLGHDSDYSRISVNQRYALTQDFDIRLEFQRIKRSDEGLLSLNFYF